MQLQAKQVQPTARTVGRLQQADGRTDFQPWTSSLPCYWPPRRISCLNRCACRTSMGTCARTHWVFRFGPKPSTGHHFGRIFNPFDHSFQFLPIILVLFSLVQLFQSSTCKGRGPHGGGTASGPISGKELRRNIVSCGSTVPELHPVR